MATISFDREFRIKPENMDRFLDILEQEPSYRPQYIDVDKEIEKGHKLLEQYFAIHGGNI